MGPSTASVTRGASVDSPSMRARRLELRLLGSALVAAWGLAAILVLLAYRPGGPFDIVVGITMLVPLGDRDQRCGVATGGPWSRHLSDGRGAGGRIAPAAAAIDRRRAQPAAGARIADADAVARGRLSVAARAGGDKPVRRFRPRPPAGRRDRAPATAAACRDRVGGRVHRACRYLVRGRRDRQRARVARPDDTTRGVAIRADRCRGRAPAMRRRPGSR